MGCDVTDDVDVRRQRISVDMIATCSRRLTTTTQWRPGRHATWHRPSNHTAVDCSDWFFTAI